MRVLFVHDFYQQYGGEDAVVESEMDALQRAGLETRLYARRNDEMRHFGPLRIAACGLAAIQSSRTRRELDCLVREFRPDVAYVHNVYPLISPAAYDQLSSCGVPIVQAMHNFRPFCANGLFYVRGEVCRRCASGNYWNAVLRGCMPHGRAVTSIYAASLWWMRRSGAFDKIDTFMCLSSFVAELLIEAGLPSAKVVVKQNSIDLTGIAPDYENGGYALFLGRLAPEKGLTTLIEAARTLPRLPLVIAGAGPMEGELARAAAGLANVRFAGFQSGRDKRELLRGAQFVVLCSEWYENFPLVLLEAFAAGKPVIGSALGSLPRLLEDGKTGLLFRAGSASDLAEKMERLAGSPELRRSMGFAARRTVEDRYDRRRAVSDLIHMFENVIGRRGRTPSPSGIPEPAMADARSGES